jgi:hypothetical protein
MSGLIPEPMNCYDDYRLLHYGIGFTNIVARCTKGSADLTRSVCVSIVKTDDVRCWFCALFKLMHRQMLFSFQYMQLYHLACIMLAVNVTDCCAVAQISDTGLCCSGHLKM